MIFQFRLKNDPLPIQRLYFDIRKKEGKSCRRTVKENVLVREPGSIYMGHIIPQSGPATNIKLSCKILGKKIT